jgi:glycosyltransferase involved in cell wall biosynthesis
LKISIVVPTLNSEKFLEPCLKSILNGGASDLEYIVVDGGSEDGTLEIVGEFGAALKAAKKGKLRTLIGKDKNEPDAINKGFALASGDVLAWLDSDDEYEPGALGVVERYFVEHPKVDWAYGRCRIVNGKGEVCRSWLTTAKEVFQKRYSYLGLLLGDFLAQPAVFFHTGMLDKVGELDISEKLAFDYDLWLKMGKVANPGYIDADLARWRAHGSSETAKALMSDMKDGLRLAKRYSEGRRWLRPAQYAVHGAAIAGYWATGVLKQKVASQ